MYSCNDCHSLFVNPIKITDTHGLDCPPYEVHWACPMCHSFDIEEAVRCGMCDEYITGDYILLGKLGAFCDSCYIAVKR